MDVAWWIEFLPVWNGSERIFDVEHQPAVHFSSDASLIGYGAHYDHRFIQGSWSQEEIHRGCTAIHVLEMAAVIFACAAFAPDVTTRRLLR